MQVRANVDSIGGHSMKVIPCGGLTLHSRVCEAITAEEPDWERPWGGSVWRSAWGSQRTVFFAGLEYAWPTDNDCHFCFSLPGLGGHDGSLGDRELQKKVNDILCSV